MTYRSSDLQSDKSSGMLSVLFHIFGIISQPISSISTNEVSAVVASSHVKKREVRNI